MRSKLLLGLVSASLLFSLTLQGQKTKDPGLSVRQQFDSEISNLKKNLKSVKKPDDKWKFLSKAEKDIEALRKKNPLQVDPEEIHMDLVTSSLKLVPRGNQFKKEKCSDYRSTIIAAFDPQSPEKPAPPIAETLSILETLCL